MSRRRPAADTPTQAITLQVYAHLYARADHANTAREALDASDEPMAGSRGG